MRLPILSATAVLLVAGVAPAQNSGDSGNAAPTLPVGQTFKQFTFPVYAEGQLKYTLFATEAKGVTLNRAETSNLKIDVYDNGAKTTTITSPKADLYVAEQKMRTKNTVHIERADMDATSQDCDFDVKAKKFLLRTRVKVLLKHFDVGAGSPGTKPATSTPAPVPASEPAPAPTSTPAPVPEPVPDNAAAAPAPVPAASGDSMLGSPGALSDTNSAPLPPSSSTSK